MNWKRKKTAKEIAILIAKGIGIFALMYAIMLLFAWLAFVWC